MPDNDPFYGCLTFRTLRRNSSAGFSRPVAFALPRTLRQDAEIQFSCRPTISFMVVYRSEHSDVTESPDSVALSLLHCPEPFGQTRKLLFKCRPTISFTVVERFAHSDVTAAPASVALSRFHCPEPFGKTWKCTFNAGQRSFLWLFKVSHTQP